ncbi:hypothetical protein Trydic_g6698 [Trypoxylus dichotomus]
MYIAHYINYRLEKFEKQHQENEASCRLSRVTVTYDSRPIYANLACVSLEGESRIITNGPLFKVVEEIAKSVMLLICGTTKKFNSTCMDYFDHGLF